MANDKRYTWTVSVIAIYNENELPLKLAYEEFEESIQTIESPNKDINFVIFFYNSNSEIAIIKKAEAINGVMNWTDINLGKVDIYEEKHQVLKDFFEFHVAKDGLEENEEHKHMLITWGHGAGLGFMKSEIDSKIQKLYDDYIGQNNIEGHYMKDSSEEIHQISTVSSKICKFNNLTTHLTLTRSHDDAFNDIKDRYFNWIFNKSVADNSILKTEFNKTFNCITPDELAEIIRSGLSKDKSTVSSEGNVPTSPLAKVQVMLCLTCYVNMIETAFAFKDIVNVYISPQTEIPFYGYNYKELFALLNRHCDVNEKQIAINITDFYLSKFLTPVIQGHIDPQNPRLIFDINYKSGIAFAAVYLNFYEKIADKIKEFIDFIKQEIGQNTVMNSLSILNVLTISRSKCLSMQRMGIGDIGIIDYENFITEVLQLFDRKHRGNFRQFYSFSHVISDYCPGSSCRSRYFGGAIAEFMSLSPGSFSIFLPDLPLSDIENELIDLYKKMSTKGGSFLQRSGWHSIIDLFIPSPDS